jgi:N-acetylglutamate synthase-like GNAT family acetyltransferase
MAAPDRRFAPAGEPQERCVAHVRDALAIDLPRIAQFYADTQYTGGLSPLDRIVVAEHEGTLVGAYRLAREEGVLVLRGMRVASAWQGRGVGTRMLRHLEPIREPCFCVPYSHLTAFYARAGFVAASRCPAFLRQRVATYRSRDLDVCVMVRESGIASQRDA